MKEFDLMTGQVRVLYIENGQVKYGWAPIDSMIDRTSIEEDGWLPDGK